MNYLIGGRKRISLGILVATSLSLTFSGAKGGERKVTMSDVQQVENLCNVRKVFVVETLGQTSHYVRGFCKYWLAEFNLGPEHDSYLDLSCYCKAIIGIMQ